MKYKFIVSFVLLLIIVSCKEEKPIHEQLKVNTDEFTVSSDTTIFGPKGTRIYIGKDIFRYPDGTLVNDSIHIELREYYDISDIVFSDISTISDSSIIETAGMIYINATAGGKDLMIDPGKRLIVHFPKDVLDKREMNLFIADNSASDSSISNWEIDTLDVFNSGLVVRSWIWLGDSTIDESHYQFLPKNCTDHDSCIQVINNLIFNFQFTNKAWNELNTFNRYVGIDLDISKEGKLINPKMDFTSSFYSKSTEKELFNLINELPLVEPFKDANGNAVEMNDFGLGLEVVSNPYYFTDRDYLNAFEKKFMKKGKIKDLDEATLNYYIFSVSKLGWINCDRFFNYENKVDLIVDYPYDPKISFKMVFKDINSVLKAEKDENRYVFRDIPEDEKVTIIGMKTGADKLEFVFKNIIISKNPATNFVFEETSVSDLRRKLNKLN